MSYTSEMKVRTAFRFALFANLALASPLIAATVYSVTSQGSLQSTSIPARTVVLTFDDGPSPETKQILAILKENDVHAVFFVVGKEAIKYPLLKDIYESGNEIGNHTYSHTNLANMSPWRLKLELGLNRAIIAGQTGHDSRLFRPPYLGSDTLSTSSSELIHRVGKLGYVTVGEDIDSSDWKRLGVGAITAESEQAEGGIILMHDGGGDRSQTVKALPQIIEFYKSRGFHFATLSEALGQPAQTLMPAVSGGEQILAYLASVLFLLAHWLGVALRWVIYILIAASFGRIVFVLTAALIQSRRKIVSGISPACSIIVPAYNEGAVIQSCLKSLLASDYPKYEILMIDDGSKDNTVALAHEIVDSRLRIISKPNGGKASALNYGIERARGPVIVAIDADTVFQPDTLTKLLRHFSDPRVGAVSGNTRIANRNSLLTKLQSLEYVVGFNLDRRMGDLFDCITVVPGAIGAFRRDVLQKIGGFAYDTLAEDTDLTLHIKEAGYRIVYDSEAVAYTEAPSTVGDLLKQRFRWTFGTMQAVWKHRGSIFNPKQGALGMIGLPYLFFFQIVFPVISPLFDVAVISGIVNHQYQTALISFVIYTSADVVMSGIALYLDGEAFWSLWLLIPQRILYRQLMYYVIVKSVINVLRGNLVGWGTLKREGSDLADLAT
jgi:cellulose synthase/poly-beta-1,6-N-acetylglucosamine synthase-like glycosyltransferase/peptidoglycan/xylan/chitin deacetylase (PgdA/CDA1 family)